MPTQNDNDCGCHGPSPWTIVAIIVFALASGFVFALTGALFFGLPGQIGGGVFGAVVGACVGRAWRPERFTDFFIVPPRRRRK